MQEKTSNKKTARVAGLLYLIVVVTGIFSLAYVPAKLIVPDNAPATVHNIMTSGPLFRLGIFSSLTCYTFFFFLPLTLYKLLAPVNKGHARLMVVLAMVSVPVSFINIVNKFAVLSLLRGADIGGNEQLQAQVMFYLDLYNSGILIVQIFWGLWLFPFGHLVFKSGFLPKILGFLLMAGCAGYLVNVSGHILFSGYAATGISGFVRLPASLGEIGTCLWLLVIGLKEKPAMVDPGLQNIDGQANA